MIALSASNLSKSYGTDVILENISFHINQGDRVGMIGVNGAGKTTLLNLLSGQLAADSGEVFTAKDSRIGYLRQRDNFASGRTVMEEVQEVFRPIREMEQEIDRLAGQIADLAGEGKAPETDKRMATAMDRIAYLQDVFRNRDGYSWQSEMNGILTSMAFGEETYDTPVEKLSGGERTRLALACLLMEKPDILFLDEPTNHLDIGTLKWLEQYLKGYKGTIVLISHDRYFLDQTVTRIFEVEHHHLTVYEGNYTFFAEEKRAQRAAQQKAYDKQQAEIRRQEDLIRRYKERGTEKLAKRAASREKRLEKVERLERPENLPDHMRLQFHQEFQSGNDVFFAEGLGKSFPDGGHKTTLFSGVNLDIKRGERICIVGPNGCGKTTLLRMLTGDTAPTEGYLKQGHNVEIGYYDQEQKLLHENLSVMEEVHDQYRLYTDGEIRNILGRFLFRGDQVFLQVGSLSGGEKAKLALVKLMLSGANTLILDEPTNHLDIDSKEVIEEALLDFPGTILTVSHDRYFLNRIPTRILELSAEGFTEFLGKYDYYEEKKASIQSAKQYVNALGKAAPTGQGTSEATSDPSGQGISGPDGQGSQPPAGLSAAEERERKKQQEAAERRVAREKTRLEEKITALEEELQMLEAEMGRPEYRTDHGKLTELSRRAGDVKTELDSTYESWLNL